MRLLTVDVRHHVELASHKQHACYFHWIMHVMAVIRLFFLMHHNIYLFAEQHIVYFCVQ